VTGATGSPNVVCGAMTPGEMLSARRLGADVIKLFPAAPLGPGYLKQVLAPLAGTPILAVGGIDAGNARDYLAAGAIGVAVGSALVAEESVRAQDWPEIERRAGALVAGLAKS
ncbi:MAG: bifunctional 4-hydroxy-2-oxoglutarate aldolase/2-dehydro-3-deoxy-phosphogluconate aldolase, partial [Deinococcota bacterium]|nr:bifunctional 4-hydroxy-2-oxoglutarate aldolase/2-dehydro-3-deoxy-phosphogluconate aldolase [Deinococcota bacterium]